MTFTEIVRHHGCDLVSSEELPEIGGVADVLVHRASGARLLLLRNDDANKAFSITFRTPPADDTGVFHILEHSVLNGSRRFPVKEPFVNLLKTSMQTFLNAMTFPDKTMYPVASANEQDLLNLMDVYLDAVFHPAIYRKEAVFRQEGWHYELRDEAEEDAEDRRLRINGVVYNEMKGALSDAESVLYDTLQQLLFPDTPYRFESGGTPESIPALTYERFLEEHARHYRPDNSYIVLYGAFDVDRMLGFLDERYLTPVADELRRRAGVPLPPPRELPLQRPVATRGFSKRMATTPEHACAAAAYVIGRARDRERLVATDILLDALAGSNEAPLKRALLDAGLGADVSAYVADALAQPFAVVEMRGIRPGKAEAFYRTLEDAVGRILAEGVDRDLLEASLSRAEFALREGDFGMADGVALSMASLCGWLYDDSLPCAYLRYEDVFAHLRARLDDGWFDELLRGLFVENEHFAQAEIVPDPECADEEGARLAGIERALSPADLDRIGREAESLRREQERLDTPEALSSLPHLSVADIEDVPDEPPYSCEQADGIPCIRHRIETKGIAYACRYFDLSCVSFEELPYVSLLASLLGKMDTRKHTAAELDTLINGKLGNLAFSQNVVGAVDDPTSVRALFVADASSLAGRADWMASLTSEILLSTDFSDVARIEAVCRQRKAAMENAFVNAGNAAAGMRLASYYLPLGMVAEKLSGVDMYRFVKDLLADFEAHAKELPGKLTGLARRIFTDGNQILSLAGSDEACSRYVEAGARLGGGGAAQAEPSLLRVPEPMVRNEAFVVPSDVCFAAQGFDHRLIGADYESTWAVAARALNYDYLWNEVRVKGGAYGAGIQARRAGTLRLYSYRDPHLDETLSRFKEAPAWLEGFDPDAEELEGYVVATVAGIDAPLKPRAVTRRQDGDFFAGRTWAERMESRKGVLGCAKGDLAALAGPLGAALDKDARCVFGGRRIVEGSKLSWDVVDLMGE